MKTAKDIMTSEVVTVSPDTSIQEFARLLISHNISGAPVLTESGELVGIATESDLIFHNKKLKMPPVIAILDSFLFLDNPEKMEHELKKIAAACVRDICSEEIVTVEPDTPLDELATIMTEKRIHTLPVVDRDRTMLGIVGKKDIIRTIL